MNRTTVAAVLATCVLADGCAREQPAKPSPPPSDAAVLAYGYGVRPSPRVTYQPDVVLVLGGPDIIRGMSDDGITWTIDANAPGARDLSVGKIMFATARAVGRVVDVQPRGNDVAITVLPVQLTELIRDATLDIDQSLSFTSRSPVVGQAIHDARDLYVSDHQPLSDGAFQLVAQTDSTTGSGAVPLGKWEVAPFFKSAGKESDEKKESVSEIGVKISRKAGGKVKRGAGQKPSEKFKYGATVSLYGKEIRVRQHLVIAGGTLQDSSSFTLEGVEGLNVGFTSGAEDAGVLKFREENLMVDKGWNFVGPEGIPMAMTLKVKAYVELAFSSSNSTLWANGRYRINGPIGYEGGKLHKPILTVEDPMLQSIGGVTVGVAGVVMAAELRFLIGVGAKEAGIAGGYAKLIASAGVSRGSALGLPIADCRSVTLKLDFGRGVGLDFNAQFLDLLDTMTEKYKIYAGPYTKFSEKMGKAKFEFELFGKEDTWFSKTVVSPDVPICRKPS